MHLRKILLKGAFTNSVDPDETPHISDCASCFVKHILNKDGQF